MSSVKCQPPKTSVTFPLKQPRPSVVEQGWECPRCGKILAPWRSSCDCQRPTTWNTETYVGDPPGWWLQGPTCVSKNEITSTTNTTINPSSITTAWNGIPIKYTIEREKL